MAVIGGKSNTVENEVVRRLNSATCADLIKVAVRDDVGRRKPQSDHII